MVYHGSGIPSVNHAYLAFMSRVSWNHRRGSLLSIENFQEASQRADIKSNPEAWQDFGGGSSNGGKWEKEYPE